MAPVQKARSEPLKRKLTCASCGKTEKAEPNGQPFFVCAECERLIAEWKAESERTKRELAEERRSSPLYASLRALLTYEPARLAAKGSASAD